MSLESGTKDQFESRFSQRETIDVGDGGNAEVVDVPPPRATEKEAIFLSPSWAVSIDIYKYVIQNLVQTGRRTLSLNYARTGGSLEVDPEEEAFAESLPKEQLRQALQLIAVLKAKGIDQTAMIGHSQGGASTIIAATLLARRAKRGVGTNPIRNIVLFESAGLIGKDNIVRLTKGMLNDPSTRGAWGASMGELPVSAEDRAHAEREGRHIPDYAAITETNEDKDRGDVVKKEQLKYISQNPVRAFGGEVWGLSKIQVHGLLRELREEHGIGILVISDVDSALFPIAKIAGTLDGNGAPQPGTLTAADVDGFLAFRGDHALRVPQVKYIEGWLSQLEEKQKRSA
jgi:hypothetical protein